MKTVPVLTLLAALGALVVLPLTFEAGVSTLFAAGLLGLLISDYAAVIRPRPMRRVPVPSPANEHLRLAA